MPLAVARVSVADLPRNLQLNDSMAMPGGKPLSAATDIQLVARVSSSGSVAPQAGDLQGETGQLTIQQAREGVELVIDNQL